MVYTQLKSFCSIIAVRASTHDRQRAIRRSGGSNMESEMFPMYWVLLKIVDLLNTVLCMILFRLSPRPNSCSY